MKNRMGKSLYSVYDTKTTLPLITYATSHECAVAMGIKPESFYQVMWKAKNGIINKYEIIKENENEWICECADASQKSV